MTKKINLLLFGSLIYITSFAQTNHARVLKAPVTPAQFGKFASVISVSLSNNGKYAVYSINDPAGNTGGSYIKAIDASWQSGKVGYGEFTGNSRYYIYKHSGDSLAFFDLQTRRIQFIPGVDNYKWGGNRIAYLLKSTHELVVTDPERKNRNVYKGVADYFFNDDGTVLLIVATENNALQVLRWVNVTDNTQKIIWQADEPGSKADGFVFSKSNGAIAFRVQSNGETFIAWCNAMDNARIVAGNKSLTDNTLFVEAIDYKGFTPDQSGLFISLKEKTRPKPASDMAAFDLWSYTDVKLQSQQLKQLRPKTFTGLLNLESGKLMRMQEPDQQILGISGRYALVATLSSGAGAYDDWYWNPANASAVYIVSLTDGKRTLIQSDLPQTIASRYCFSPGGNYVVYYDVVQADYFSYDIQTGKRINITSGLDAAWTEYSKRDVPMGKYLPIFSAGAGGIENDQAIFLYDQWDIYQVDLSGKSKPLCLTAGYGRKNNIEFRMAIENTGSALVNGQKVIVSAFSRETKQDGFYSVTVGKAADPVLLQRGPYVYKGTWEDERFIPVYPVKAKDADVYIVRRASAAESPNFFSTKDFKKFDPVTDLHPEKDYNWVTSELVNWKLPDGSPGQGVLYKPENFDPTKKYPLIIHYYERKTEGTHAFIAPEVSHGELNIPYFVSNGYLVLTPDIHYQIGHTGNSVVNTITSAIDHLAQLPYVDAAHVGIQGHSRGGWETNFLVTHSNKFAAAVSAAGFCDYVTLYNGVRLKSSGLSRQSTYENVYQRMGATLWEKPDIYIENSPVFMADKVTTPVLMFANKDDDDVPFEQGIEFFTALRRLGKKAWMLQYDGEEHLVFDKAADDFTIRMKQFFDHYLKGEPAPKWMLYGIPAKDKGIADGLELVKKKDANGNWVTPGPGLPRTDSGMK